MSDEKEYTVTPDNRVIGPDGVSYYEEGDPAVAKDLANFLNAKNAFEEALEKVLDEHDYPLSGTEWQEILRRIAIRGEQS